MLRGNDGFQPPASGRCELEEPRALGVIAACSLQFILAGVWHPFVVASTSILVGCASVRALSVGAVRVRPVATGQPVIEFLKRLDSVVNHLRRRNESFHFFVVLQVGCTTTLRLLRHGFLEGMDVSVSLVDDVCQRTNIGFEQPLLSFQARDRSGGVANNLIVVRALIHAPLLLLIICVPLLLDSGDDFVNFFQNLVEGIPSTQHHCHFCDAKAALVRSQSAQILGEGPADLLIHTTVFLDLDKDSTLCCGGKRIESLITVQDGYSLGNGGGLVGTDLVAFFVLYLFVSALLTQIREKLLVCRLVGLRLLQRLHIRLH
mmetsp:Transcript_10412/g.22840  ORF Transcript_10412/g.22840 Transcript_10412/m.22840 type:complete len:318 (-) Transcript_10412:964-1917(-)